MLIDCVDPEIRRIEEAAEAREERAKPNDELDREKIPKKMDKTTKCTTECSVQKYMVDQIVCHINEAMTRIKSSAGRNTQRWTIRRNRDDIS